jgi:hypothetical protein
MKGSSTLHSTAGPFCTRHRSGRRQILATLLAAVVTVSPVGLAPTAFAKGIVLPRDTCVGPQIAANGCTRPAQPLPAHMVSPHGSKHRKIELALAKEAPPPTSTSDSASTERDSQSN